MTRLTLTMSEQIGSLRVKAFHLYYDKENPTLSLSIGSEMVYLCKGDVERLNRHIQAVLKNKPPGKNE